MRSKNATIRELLADIRTAAQQEQYNPAEDLKTTRYLRVTAVKTGIFPAA